MTCDNCQCGKSTHPLQPLFNKLTGAKFSGVLELRFESGAIAAAKLEHFLPFAELGRELPIIEKDELKHKA
jgi:hypothetical protein